MLRLIEIGTPLSDAAFTKTLVAKEGSIGGGLVGFSEIEKHELVMGYAKGV